MFLCANAQRGAYKQAYLSLYSFLSSEAVESRGGGRDQRAAKVSEKTRCGGDVGKRPRERIAAKNEPNFIARI
jgi:hypothetical protein